MKNNILFLMFFVFISFNLAQNQNDWKLSGQVQLRSELDGRDFSNKTYPLTFSTIRTRIGIEKFVSDKIQFFAQLQDSRALGQGTPTTFLSNVDLYQGFVKLINPFDLGLEVQAGRFQMIYGTERFIGASNWSYTARSFDGVRFSIDPKNIDLDVFAITVNEKQAIISNPAPALYPNPSKENESFSLYGFYKRSSLTEKSKLDLFGYYEIDRKDIKPDTNTINRFTIGTTYSGNYGNFSTLVEAAYQFGKLEGLDLAAYLASIQGSYNFGVTTLTAGADILSGNNPKEPKKRGAFNVGYGTNHKFYGYMDYFPANASGLGINNFYLKVDLKPSESKFNFMIDFHHFMTNQKSSSDKNILGQELDLTVVYRLVPGTSITWGGSLFFPGDLMKSDYAPREDIAFWSFVMITANF